MGNYSVNVFEKAQRWVKSHLFSGTKCVGTKCSADEVCRGRNVPGTKCAGDEVFRGRNAPGDEVFPGTKCTWGRNGCEPNVQLQFFSKS